MNTRQSVVYLPKAKRRRQMSLQVDSVRNGVNKTPPSDKKEVELPTEYAMQYKQRELQL
jgi:hypothetical protein